MLKAVPNKNAGFIILCTSIFILFYFMRSLSLSFYFILFTSSRFNGFYLCFWFLNLFSFIWIGGQFPVDNFLSYGRILTCNYYYLIICILLSFYLVLFAFLELLVKILELWQLQNEDNERLIKDRSRGLPKVDEKLIIYPHLGIMLGLNWNYSLGIGNC